MTAGSRTRTFSVLLLLTLVGGVLAAVRANASDCPVSPGPVIDVTTCPVPAVPDDNEDDTDAINHAIEQIHALDGGRVYFPPGTYDAANVKHRSGVELNGPSTAILRRLPGPASLIVGHVTDHTGRTTAGSRTLTNVSNPEDFEQGAVVGIRGGAGGSNAQRTTLSAPVPAEGSPFVLANGAGFPPSTDFLKIDNEIIWYRSQNGTKNAVLQNVGRGRFATGVSPHNSGAAVRLLQRLYARVVSVSGTTVTIDRPVPQKLSSTEISVGGVNMAVTGLTLDGRPTHSTVNTFPLKYELARNVRISTATIINGEHGGVRFAHGTSESVVENSVLLNNGDPANGLGAVIWLFQGAGQNIVRNNQIGSETDASNNGIMADDRTDTASEWDGPSDGNRIEGNIIKIPRAGDNAAVAIQGSANNVVSGNEIYYMFDGVRVHKSRQGSHPLTSRLNTVSNNRLTGNVNYALTVTGVQNTIRDNAVVDSGNNCRDYTGTPPQNSWSGNTTDDGSLCPASSQLAPSSSSGGSAPLIGLGDLSL